MRRVSHSRLVLALAVSVLLSLFTFGSSIAAQAGGTFQVGGSAVTYSAPWILDAEGSSPQLVMLMHATFAGTGVMYGEIQERAVTDAVVALDTVLGSAAADLDAGSVTVRAESEPGAVAPWRLIEGTYNGIAVANLTTTATPFGPGAFTMMTLISPSSTFHDALVDVQAGIDIGGAGSPLSGLDPLALTGTLGQAAPASTTATVAETYRAQDAPTGCDRIGWAITDPAQVPTTEAEIAQRGACAGGVTWVAKCGTVPGERADQRYLTCEVTALVTEGPQEFAFDMFALILPDGRSEYIDFGMSFGNDGLFDSGPVQVGQTVTGTAPFVVDASVVEPLVLEIRPPSLPAGVEPAVIVIEGPLQELATLP